MASGGRFQRRIIRGVERDALQPVGPSRAVGDFHPHRLNAAAPPAGAEIAPGRRGVGHGDADAKAIPLLLVCLRPEVPGIRVRSVHDDEKPAHSVEGLSHGCAIRNGVRAWLNLPMTRGPVPAKRKKWPPIARRPAIATWPWGPT